MSIATRGRDADPEIYPELRQMQAHVDEMERLADEAFDALPFHLVRWHRIRREWKANEKEWKRLKPLHLTRVDDYNEILFGRSGDTKGHEE